LFSCAAKDRRVSDNPFEDLEWDRGKKNSRSDFTPDERARVLRLADNPDPVDALDIARMEIGQLLVLLTTKRGEPVSPINCRIVACWRVRSVKSPITLGWCLRVETRPPYCSASVP
jgi:hypothetical protein